MFPMAGGLFSLVSSVASIGFGIAGQQQQMQGAEQVSNANISSAVFQGQIQAAQYQYNYFLQQRKITQAMRQGQVAQAQSFGTIQSQGGNQFGSAYGGARAQTEGETSTAVSNIGAGLTASKQIFGLNQSIDAMRIMAAQGQAEEAQGAGTAALGKDIGAIGSAFGSFIGGPGASSGFNLGSITSGLNSLFPQSGPTTGNDLFAGIGMPA